MPELVCYKCKDYNSCVKKVKTTSSKVIGSCFVEGEPDIPKPCNETCEFYCGTCVESGVLCSYRKGWCKKYTDWFLSKNGWRKTVEPFRKLKKKGNK